DPARARTEVEDPGRRCREGAERHPHRREALVGDAPLPSRREPVERPCERTAEEPPSERNAHDDGRDDPDEPLPGRHATAMRSSPPAATPVKPAASPWLIASVISR